MPEDRKFKVVADWEPAGDQPKAIAELSEALMAGAKRLTLLGATGTGKSLDADEPILVYRPLEDGTWISECVPIGALIDEQLAEASSVDRVADTEISRENPSQYHVLSFNPRNCKSELKPITAFVRHEAPETMYRVRLACGREALMTGDHNLWVLRKGRLKLIETRDAQEGDYLALPESLPPPGRELDAVNVLELVRGEKMYVDCGPIVDEWTELYGRRRVRAAFQRHLGSGGDTKLSRIRNGRPGRGVLVDTFLALAKELEYELTPKRLDMIRIGARLGEAMLPARLPLTGDVLALFGHSVAEAGDRKGAAANHGQRAEANDRHGGAPGGRHAADVSSRGRTLSMLLAKACGKSADQKRLPSFWGALGNRQLSRMLQAYFDVAAGVEGEAVACTTASRALASDLAYALARFGIRARIERRVKAAVGAGAADEVAFGAGAADAGSVDAGAVHAKSAETAQSDGRHTYHVRIVGQAALRTFAREIGFGLERKRLALRSTLRSPSRNALVVGGGSVGVLLVGGGSQFAVGQHRRLQPNIMGFHNRFPRGAVRFSAPGFGGHRLAGGRPWGTWQGQGSWAQRALGDGSAGRIPLTLGVPSLQTIMDRPRHPGRVRWSRIAGVEAVPYDKPFVYDVSVAENETFLGGFGGLFVHNTYTMAKVIEKVQKPTLVIAHNKTLAAQLCSEFRAFFPHNAVHYFISYYDYYQPEAYIPHTDTYIEKDSSINDEIDRLRHAATSALFERRDVIIVASVSCIYGLGSPEDYVGMTLSLQHGDFRDRDKLLRKLVGIQYTRNDIGFTRGTFRVRGDCIEIVPVYEENVIRIEFFGDEVDRILELDPVTGEVIDVKESITIYPATHFITSEEKMKRALQSIEAELAERLAWFREKEKLLEAQRLEQRTLYDLEMLREIGFCQGVENYSRHMDGRSAGEPPATLLDYFPQDYLMVIDESHQTIPQVHGMYRGDRSRKETLVEYGFRLPSALDNRPLQFDEFVERINQVVFVSATPGPYEQKVSEKVVEQIIRPTGLVDPEVIVRPVAGQIDDLLAEVEEVTARGERVLVTTLTKKMAEELTDYLADAGVRVRYLHSDIASLERVEILRSLRLGEFDVLVGINLLREGLDLPEVSLVAILDADKEGFLRSDTALIQTTGRAARNVNGRVIMYADTVTGSMARAIEETNRRRAIQMAYNEEHGITPETVRKRVHDAIRAEPVDEAAPAEGALERVKHMSSDELAEHIQQLEAEMFAAAKELQFERAAALRDEIAELRSALLEISPGVHRGGPF